VRDSGNWRARIYGFVVRTVSTHLTRTLLFQVDSDFIYFLRRLNAPRRGLVYDEGACQSLRVFSIDAPINGLRSGSVRSHGAAATFCQARPMRALDGPPGGRGKVRPQLAGIPSRAAGHQGPFRCHRATLDRPGPNAPNPSCRFLACTRRVRLSQNAGLDPGDFGPFKQRAPTGRLRLIRQGGAEFFRLRRRRPQFFKVLRPPASACQQGLLRRRVQFLRLFRLGQQEARIGHRERRSAIAIWVGRRRQHFGPRY